MLMLTLTESPEYWAKKMPKGYLKTVPTASLLHSFADMYCPVGGAELILVVGIDNLNGMTSWNDSEAIFSRADLVVFGRDMKTLSFTKDPSALLNNFLYFKIDFAVPVLDHQGKYLFGADCGVFRNPDATGFTTLHIMSPLDELEGCSSTALRKAVSLSSPAELSRDPTVNHHGYTDATSIGLLRSVSFNSDSSITKEVAFSTDIRQRCLLRNWQLGGDTGI